MLETKTVTNGPVSTEREQSWPPTPPVAYLCLVRRRNSCFALEWIVKSRRL
jgi:hypothetical protein